MISLQTKAAAFGFAADAYRQVEDVAAKLAFNGGTSSLRWLIGIDWRTGKIFKTSAC